MENTEPTKTVENISTTDHGEGKKIAIIAYITWIGLIIAFVMNNDKKIPLASYHIRQVLGLTLTGIVLGFIAIIPILGLLIWIVGILILIYMWIMGLVNAINERQQPMPILGAKYEEWFKGL
ncbi:MAG: hypothetical protein CR989_05060 [Flavobacteriales bacterium]|nr:MAG: hypothetical protein CR989_05060 [Flavobacteriales bacterium]